MKKSIKKLSKIFIPAILGLFLFSSVASAHVTVAPKTSTTGAWETYTVKVPTEKEIPTTKFTLKTPEGAEFESYQPVPGWTFSSEKDASGKVKSITFETTGEGIMPVQFQQFTFVVKNPANAAKLAWDAFQYYKDGSIVEWTGDESAKTPHSITDIVEAAATGDHHDTQPTMDHPTKETKTSDAKTIDAAKSDSLPLILSIVALLLSLGALFAALRKK